MLDASMQVSSVAQAGLPYLSRSRTLAPVDHSRRRSIRRTADFGYFRILRARLLTMEIHVATHKTILRFVNNVAEHISVYKKSTLSTCYLFLSQSNIPQFSSSVSQAFFSKHQVQFHTISFSITASQFSGSPSSASISYQPVSL